MRNAVSWTRVVAVELVRRGWLKGRDHRMCTAWVVDVKNHNSGG